MQRCVLELTWSTVSQLEQWRTVPGSERVIVRSETFLTEPLATRSPFSKKLALDKMDDAKSLPAVMAGAKRVTSTLIPHSLSAS